MITCKVGENIINCYDGNYNKEELKKWSNKKILICPVCEKPYEYCHGKIKSPYFRHKDKNACESIYSEPESEEHIKGKRDLFEWIKRQEGVSDVVLEGWIPETKQRPDILFEYQCSTISSEYYERHNLYKTAGISDIWICGTEKYFQYYHKGSGFKRISTIEEESNAYYDSSKGCFYKIVKELSCKNYENIINSKTYVNLMKNPSEYKYKHENFYLIKDKYKSYLRFSYYPSPTGRSSRKYPYPVTAYRYHYNVSLAKCEKLSNITLLNLINIR